MSEYSDNQKYKINNDKYFMIFKYDIRIYNYRHDMLLEINTYPNDPRYIIQLINYFN